MIIWLGIMKRISCSILRPRDAVACTDANNRKSKKRRSTNKIMYKSLLQNLLLPFFGVQEKEKNWSRGNNRHLLSFFCQLTSLTLRWFLKLTAAAAAAKKFQPAAGDVYRERSVWKPTTSWLKRTNKERVYICVVLRCIHLGCLFEHNSRSSCIIRKRGREMVDDRDSWSFEMALFFSNF